VWLVGGNVATTPQHQKLIIQNHPILLLNSFAIQIFQVTRLSILLDSSEHVKVYELGGM
jgi:hypothetical protein